MSPADWLGVVNGAMLAALSVRAFWGWIFGREHTEAVLTRQLREIDTRLEDLEGAVERRLIERRRREHQLSNGLQVMEVSLAVLKQRVDHIEDKE